MLVELHLRKHVHVHVQSHILHGLHVALLQAAPEVPPLQRMQCLYGECVVALGLLTPSAGRSLAARAVMSVGMSARVLTHAAGRGSCTFLHHVTPSNCPLDCQRFWNAYDVLSIAVCLSRRVCTCVLCCAVQEHWDHHCGYG